MRLLFICLVALLFSNVASVAQPSPAAGPAAQQRPVSPAQRNPAGPNNSDANLSSEPQSTAAVYGDWVLRCTLNVGASKLKVCEISQTLVDQNNNSKVAEIAIGRPFERDKLSSDVRIVVALGNNVAFSAPMRLAADEKDQPIDLTYRRCIPSGCFADAQFTNEIASRWRTRTERGRLAFIDGANREIALPFSMRGLAQALDAYSKL